MIALILDISISFIYPALHWFQLGQITENLQYFKRSSIQCWSSYIKYANTLYKAEIWLQLHSIVNRHEWMPTGKWRLHMAWQFVWTRNVQQEFKCTNVEGSNTPAVRSMQNPQVPSLGRWYWQLLEIWIMGSKILHLD